MNGLFVRRALPGSDKEAAAVHGRIPDTRNSLRDAVEPVCSVMRLFAAWPAKPPSASVDTRHFFSSFIFSSYIVASQVGINFQYYFSECAMHPTGAGGRAVLLHSLQLAAQVGVLLLLGREGLRVLGDRVLYMRAGAGVTHTVLALQFLLYLCILFTLPVIWLDASRLAPVWEGWGHLQTRLERVCGRRLASASASASSRARSRILAGLLLLLWPPLVAVPLMLLPETKVTVRQAWFYAYPSLVTFSLKLLWLRLLTALHGAADTLVTSFRKESRSWVLLDSAARLRAYRELWSSIRDVMEDIGVLGGLSQLSVQAIQVLSLLTCFVQVTMSILEVRSCPLRQRRFQKSRQ
ncbi:Gustatory and odorant receptor 24 [Frankliniella fusca]|uniref:Gustatory and odorant receptor 24 n=1 Tax=Frankliniella fusca TaxID=407009 RepID=A0AAE1GSK1_9NEOP|nr:Gustatory and odorant receptor 24 [Frankliniella fusca]